MTDTAWYKIYEYLSQLQKIHTNNEGKTQRFVKGVFWIFKALHKNFARFDKIANHISAFLRYVAALQES
jgi:hypothetical protein